MYDHGITSYNKPDDYKPFESITRAQLAKMLDKFATATNLTTIRNTDCNFTDIDQITVQGYIMDEATKSEGIEALIYPADDLFKRLNVMRNTPEAVDPVQSAISEIVEKVNKNQASYAKISKITILEEALEMTTTKKVKRNYNK
mgnify:CR=1 FL=1